MMMRIIKIEANIFQISETSIDRINANDKEPVCAIFAKTEASAERSANAKIGEKSIIPIRKNRTREKIFRYGSQIADINCPNLL